MTSFVDDFKTGKAKVTLRLTPEGFTLDCIDVLPVNCVALNVKCCIVVFRLVFVLFIVFRFDFVLFTHTYTHAILYRYKQTRKGFWGSYGNFKNRFYYYRLKLAAVI